MSDTLSDKTIDHFVNDFYHDLASDYAKAKIKAMSAELQRWRAAFAWLERVSGSVEGPGWCAWADDTGKHAIGDTVLEAIEALRAKVEAKP
jgi:hypothetical protein